MKTTKDQVEAKEPVWLLLALVAFVYIVSFCAFLPALGFDYNPFDDHGTLFENEGWRGLKPENLQWMFTSTAMGHYQPLAWLSFGIEYSFAGMNPAVSHTVNAALHSLNAVLVMLLAAKLVRISGIGLPRVLGRAAAASAALLFAVHPLRVESVAWVTERRDVLSLAFYLGAVLAYFAAFPVASVEPESRRRYVICIGLFLLSLLSKGWGMTFFLVLLVLDWYPLKRITWEGIRAWTPATRRVLTQKVPFALAGIAWVFIAGTAASSSPGTTRTLEQWSIVSRVCQAAYGLMFYMWKTVAPTGLAALYELPKSLSPAEPRVIAGIVVTGLLAVLAILARRRAPALTVAILVYGIVVLPVLGAFQSGIQLVADRYSYISMIAPVIAAATGLAMLVRRLPREKWIIAAVPVGVLVAGLFALTWRQTAYWKDARVLFAHAIDVGQEGPILRASYGRQLDDAGLKLEAIEQFNRSLALEPRYGEAWFDLARVLKDLKRTMEAKAAYVKAQEFMSDSWRADQDLGLLYAEQLDDLPAALPLFESAVRKIEGPEAWSFQPGPYITLAQALYDSGDVKGATRLLEKALRHKETHERAAAALRMIAGGGGR